MENHGMSPCPSVLRWHGTFVPAWWDLRRVCRFTADCFGTCTSIQADTLPETNVAPKNWMVGMLLSYWEGLFSVAMLVLVPLCILRENRCPGWWVGWVGDDDVLCTCAHVTCYATGGVVGWGGLGMMTFFALVHMWRATQLMGWWGGVGTCIHVTCYA